MGILDQLLEKKDLKAYLHFRQLHLLLEKEAIYHKNIDPQIKKGAIKKLEGRICELGSLKAQLNNLKESSKYECSKYNYLFEKKKKINIQKQINDNTGVVFERSFLIYGE